MRLFKKRLSWDEKKSIQEIVTWMEQSKILTISRASKGLKKGDVVELGDVVLIVE